MAVEVTPILMSAQSLDASARRQAEESLRRFQEQNLAVFLLSLAQELANNDKPAASRKLAGLLLKNSLDSKDAARKADLANAWLSLDPPFKSQIKAFLLQTLSSLAPDAGHTSAQAISKIASIELPHNAWPHLVASLLANMAGPPHLKQASLQTLGYICEEIPDDSLAQDQVNSILTAVVQRMKASESSNEVRLAAAQALCNALDFAQSNFKNEMERNYLMKVICEAALSPDMRVRQAAFECLVSIASAYYDKLAFYMQDLFEITAKAAKEDEEPIALQAIEFWSSICDEEIQIQDEYGNDFTGDSETPYFQFIKQALPALVPLLLETLTKQEEDQDQDGEAWNLSMAGGTCLGLVAKTVGDDVLPLVMPYVQENISKPDWRCREAATYAFGSILEGPSLEKLGPLVKLTLSFMLNAMKDDNNHVRDTTAWTLGRIFEFLHNPKTGNQVISEVDLPVILSVLLESIKDAPNVAEKVCRAIYFLALGYGKRGSSPLSQFFQRIIQVLLITADREDAGHTRLRASAYEALNQVIRSSFKDTTSTVMQLVPIIVTKLNHTLDIQIVSSDDREKHNELQALLCGVLQVIIQRLGASKSTQYGILQYSDQIMGLFLRVFSCRSATVHEEAMLAIGALAYAAGSEFVKYMPDFLRYLEMGLQNFEEYQVCAIAVGVAGDICRALDEKALPFCDSIMTQLLKALSSNQLHRSVKPSIFSCFGDIALAIGEHFQKYLIYAMPVLQAAAELSVSAVNQDDELLNYNNQLRSCVFEAYSAIFQGFKNTKSDPVVPFAPHVLQFVEKVYQDKERDDTVTKTAVGVIGDLADSLGANATMLLRNAPFYRDFLDECLSSDDENLKETAEWTQSMINRLCIIS